jgi:hypothetical protein
VLSGLSSSMISGAVAKGSGLRGVRSRYVD